MNTKFKASPVGALKLNVRDNVNTEVGLGIGLGVKTFSLFTNLEQYFKILSLLLKLTLETDALID